MPSWHHSWLQPRSSSCHAANCGDCCSTFFLVCLEIARHALYGLITVKIDYCDYCSFQPPKIREFEPIYVSYIQKGACVDSTTITVTVKYWLNTVCFRVNLGGERWKFLCVSVLYAYAFWMEIPVYSVTCRIRNPKLSDGKSRIKNSSWGWQDDTIGSGKNTLFRNLMSVVKANVYCLLNKWFINLWISL